MDGEQCRKAPTDTNMFLGEIQRVPAPKDQGALHETLVAFALSCAGKRKVHSVAISTAGIVHSAGTHVTKCADHLAFLREPAWKDKLEESLGCPVVLINDAEAFLLGAAVTGRVPRVGTLCCLVIGTGLGCAVSKDARFWRPQRTVPLLGSVRVGQTSYDGMASASALAAHDPQGNLVNCFIDPQLAEAREKYFADLAGIAVTAAILYGADHLLVGGGLCDAAREARFDLVAAIRRHWKSVPPELDDFPKIELAEEGNLLQLLGAGALAEGSGRPPQPFHFQSMLTELIHEDAGDLHQRSAFEIMEILCRAENEAGRHLEGSLGQLSEIAARVIRQWPFGGRIIYVGAGTSGRIAAMDAVEIPCTFGTSPDRVVAVVAGGLNEAALNIERDGEEDHSGVADMVLLQPDARDMVIGVSASGSSAFVRSALAYAHGRGAATAMIQVAPPVEESEWNWTVALHSGREVVAGSTRMKAGTATKKALNFLTTTVMAKCGKLHGPFMTDMECLNAKLSARAVRILSHLFDLSEDEAERVLDRNGRHLNRAIAECEGVRQPVSL